MGAMDDFSSWLTTVTEPGSKLRGAGYSGILGGVEKATNKSIMPQSYRMTMGRNDEATDKTNAIIGASQPQGLNFNNDWVQKDFVSTGGTSDFGTGGTTASNVGLAAATPSVSAVQEALKLGVPTEDIDFSKVLGTGTSPFGLAKALGSGVPLSDIDWGKVASADPVTGIAASLAGPVVSGLTGSKIAGSATGAAATTGMAAAQGFTNPLSDLAALMSWAKLIKGLF